MSERKLFGTDGIRGRANVYPMTGEMAMVLGRAVTAYFQKEKINQKPLIIIGKDTRLSCYFLEQAFASGVCSQGGRAILTGPIPTPGVAFVTQSMRAQAGVMISASHNPYYDNGIKIFDSNGHKLPDCVEKELEHLVLNPQEIPLVINDGLGKAKRLEEVLGRYVVHVKTGFNSSYSLENMRLVVDCANGAAYKVAQWVFTELGADVIPIGISPNGKNINDYCGSNHPQFCAQNVLKFRADLGVCLDGDGDRIAIIDSNGEVVDGDKIIGLCALFMLKTNSMKKGDEVVGTSMTNLGLENYLKGLGLNLFRTDVGDRYIVERMRQSGAKFGGEPSGHIIYKEHSTTGDGILAALKVLEAIKFFQRPLNDLIADIELYPQYLKNVVVETKTPFSQIKELDTLIKNVEKQLGDEGRLLLRYSGTEPLARVMLEGKNTQLINELGDQLASSIKKILGTA
jgi:phosphoglucosamine mutase